MEINNEKDFSKFCMSIFKKYIPNPKILSRIEGGILSKRFEDIYLGLPNNENIFIELKVANGIGIDQDWQFFKGCKWLSSQIEMLHNRIKNGNDARLLVFDKDSESVWAFRSRYLRDDILIKNIIRPSYYSGYKVFDDILEDTYKQKLLCQWLVEWMNVW